MELEPNRRRVTAPVEPTGQRRDRIRTLAPTIAKV